MRTIRTIPFVALLSLWAVSCQKEMPDCGSPIFGFETNYQIVDANTGQDWFAGPGRASGDSLRVLPARNGLIMGQQAKKYGVIYRLGPAYVLDEGQGSATQFLRFSAQDIDTVVVKFHYGPVQKGPCGESKPVQAVEITYNGHPNGQFRADVPADSLRSYGLLKTVQLRKRP